VKIYKASVKKLFFYLLAGSLCWQSTSVFAGQKLHRDDWYLSQPEESATIQMSGHESESDAIAYIEKANLSGDIGYYQTQYKNMPWYAVTYGNFNSLDEARSYLELLPEELQQHAPWPRSFKAIKVLIDFNVQASNNTAGTDSEHQEPESSLTKEPPMELNWEQGQAAYDSGDFATAYNAWKTLAEQGDELSQFNLGVMYSRGEGTKQSGSKALKWYMKSAEKGYAPAQFNLGAAYLEGKFTEADATKAAAWWQMAAEQGFVQAQFNIASLYCRGIGVSRDVGQCKFWYGRAASNGDTHARKMLDHLIALENSQNKEVAAAPGPVAETGSPDASEETSNDQNIDSAQELQPETETPQAASVTETDATLVAVAEQSLNEEQLREQKQKKPEVRQISSEEHKQLARAQKAFTRSNYKKAHDIWLPLAENGIAEAQYSLGFLYQSGWGPEQDLLQAVAWYSSAAEQNETRAQFNLGVLLINGEDEVEKDIEEGVLWLTRSADGDNTRAREFLVNAYEKGMYGIEKSKEKSEYWKSR
jgi:TPR repeat protein